ncbi:MAG: metal ABC transporter solute-binding protein, Zn/Mn family [Acidimicrobiales bacterium]
MTRWPQTQPGRRLAAVALAGALLAACSSSDEPTDTAAEEAAAGPTTASSESPASTASSASTESPASTADPCPVEPVEVVVSVDQWGDIVEELAGECATVHTVIAGSSIDPHDYEPTSTDALAFESARLVVVNGADYDPWASDLAGNAADSLTVVDAGEVVGAAEGANPHLWYSPDYVTAVAGAVTDGLTAVSPDAADYFDDRAGVWSTGMEGYEGILASLSAGVDGQRYAATESVFDYTAEAVGLEDATPDGFARAAANESDPTPNDIAAFEQALRDGDIDLLIYNTQTEGSIPEQIRQVAEDAGVPVVEVTETVAPGAASFEDWQVDQLQRLAEALSIDV